MPYRHAERLQILLHDGLLLTPSPTPANYIAIVLESCEASLSRRIVIAIRLAVHLAMLRHRMASYRMSGF
jgi:hypothetical protein